MHVLLPFLLLYAALTLWWQVPPWIGAGYFALSLCSFMVYALDKSAARARRQRTPENTLHLLALLGGWPGALLAQRLLHHKSRKASFRRVFWGTVALNVCALIVLSAPPLRLWARLPG